MIMPYISIKAYPKDEKIKKEAVDKIKQIFLDVWGCPQEALTISIEEVKPEDWNDKVRTKEIETNLDKMMILDGEKKY